MNLTESLDAYHTLISEKEEEKGKEEEDGGGESDKVEIATPSSSFTPVPMDVAEDGSKSISTKKKVCDTQFTN